MAKHINVKEKQLIYTDFRQYNIGKIKYCEIFVVELQNCEREKNTLKILNSLITKTV